MKKMKESRLGNYNAQMRSRVLNFLNNLGRDDVTIQKLSNFAVNWFVDCGKAELNFEFTTEPESYEIVVKDNAGEKIEAWAGEYPELDMDLDDTVAFIDEFKSALEGNPVERPLPPVEDEEEEIEDEEVEDEEVQEESVDSNKKSLNESEEDLSEYQKNVIKEMVRDDFECGHPENDYHELVELLGEDEDFIGVEEAAASYYMELLSYGPAGFLEEFEDELDFDPDFVAEYGNPYDDED